MKLFYLSSIILSTILLSTNLNAMELEHPSRATEFFAKLTDNNKFECTQTNKEEIARYCIQRIKYGIDEAQRRREVDYKLCSDFMYNFLKNHTVISTLNSAAKEASQDSIAKLLMPNSITQKEPHDIDIQTDMRLFYCFPQMVEKSYSDIVYKKIATSATQIEQATQEERSEYLNKILQLDQNELEKIKCGESIKLA